LTDTAAIGMVRTEVSVPDPSAPVDASRWSWKPPLHLVVAAVLALALGVLVSPGLSRGVPQYAVGDFTTRSVRAPFDFSVVDAAATERRRREAALTAPVIVAVDLASAGRLASQLGGAFAPLARLFDEADARRVPAEADVRGLSARRRAALEASRAKEADGWLARTLDQALPAFEASVGTHLAPADRTALVRERFGEHLARALVLLAERVYTPPIAADRASIDALLRRGSPVGARAARPIVLREASGAERPAAGDPPLQALDEAIVSVPARAEAVLPGVAADTRQALGRLVV